MQPDTKSGLRSFTMTSNTLVLSAVPAADFDVGFDWYDPSGLFALQQAA
jgi:hypothetical protein